MARTVSHCPAVSAKELAIINVLALIVRYYGAASAIKALLAYS